MAASSLRTIPLLAGLKCRCSVDEKLADAGAKLAHRRSRAQSNQRNDQGILDQILPFLASNQALKGEKKLLDFHRPPS